MLIMMLLSYSKCCWFCVVDGESVWYSLACVCKIVQVKLKDLGRLGRGVRHHWVTAPQVGNSTKSAQVVGRVLQEGFRHGGVCSTVQLYVDRYFCRFPGPRSTRLASVSMVYLVGDTVYGATCDCRGGYRRPQVLDNPLGSPGVEVLSSSSWGMTPTDAKVLKALIDMRSCYNCNSIMTIQLLVEVQSCFSILREYELHISLPGQHPYDTFLDSFELSIDALEWTAWPISHVPPHLSDESEMVGILWGILYSSWAIKDMTEAWLVEARISLASRGTTHLASYFTVLYWFGGLTFYCCLVDMFDLLRVKGRSAGRTLNRPTPPPSTEVPVGATEKRLVVAREKHPTAMSEKYPGKGDSELPRKKKNVTMSKLRKKVAPRGGIGTGASHRGEEADKGSRGVPQLSSHRERAMRSGRSGRGGNTWLNLVALSWVWTDGPLATEYVRRVLHPSIAKQLYKAF
ncbi:hypothetical protein GW17_00005808 [Ensete ventricosum]|nr:hypothetical protein GW17_00005808 [Ensete ventricosum]